MGEGALRSHSKSEKHKSRLKNASKAMPMSLFVNVTPARPSDTDNVIVLSFVPLTIIITLTSIERSHSSKYSASFKRIF